MQFPHTINKCCLSHIHSRVTERCRCTAHLQQSMPPGAQLSLGAGRLHGAAAPLHLPPPPPICAWPFGQSDADYLTAHPSQSLGMQEVRATDTGLVHL